MIVRNQSCLAEWFVLWRKPLRHFLLAKGFARVADWEDVFQEVFLRLLRYEATETVERPRAYVFKVAANVAAEWATRARHRFDHQPHWLDNLVIEDVRDTMFDNAVMHGKIERAVGTLSARARAILKLHFEDDLTHYDIAARLGLSLRVVRRDFERSYIKLRHELRAELPDTATQGYN